MPSALSLTSTFLSTTASQSARVALRPQPATERRTHAPRNHRIREQRVARPPALPQGTSDEALRKTGVGKPTSTPTNPLVVHERLLAQKACVLHFSCAK